MDKEKKNRGKAIVLLDIDDTLLDFHRAEAAALASALEEMAIEATETILRRYSEINKRQWELLEEGKLTRQQVLLRRFELLFEEFGVGASAEEARDRYEYDLSIGHYFIPGAPELLEKLFNTCRLFIVSNGTGSVQASRIASAGIGPYFEQIFISEELGAEKPSREFFERCFARIPDFDREKTIIVGDSLTSDIRGGINAQICSCWFNPKGKPGRADIRPDYEIRSLAELPPLLEEIFGPFSDRER